MKRVDKKAETARYAFWEYSKFPYVLSGKVVSSKNGMVGVDGFDGMLFTPLAVIRGERGKATHENLNWLRREYCAAQLQTTKHYCNLALGLAPFLKRCKRTSAYQKAKAAQL